MRLKETFTAQQCKELRDALVVKGFHIGWTPEMLQLKKSLETNMEIKSMDFNAKFKFISDNHPEDRKLLNFRYWKQFRENGIVNWYEKSVNDLFYTYTRETK